jgi:uncharacterized membrane protein YfcA
MLFGIPAYQFIEIVAALSVGGVATGFLAGLLGVGGGAIIVPILYEVFRFLGVDESNRIFLSVATSLAIIIPTALSSSRSHYRRGAVDMRVVRALGPWVAAGVVAGIFVASVAPATLLKAFFVGSAVFMAGRLLFGADATVSNDAILPKPWVNRAAGVFIGAISTLIGIGGGAYISAYMSLFGWPIHTAIGTAAAFGPIIALPAAAGYVIAGWNAPGLPPLSLGYVSLLGAAVLSPLSVLVAPFGARVAHSLSRQTLQRIFAVFLLLVAARFAYSLAF